MAIAFNNAADLGNAIASSSLTASYTVGSGSNRLFVAGVLGDQTSDFITGATYGGVPMTLLYKQFVTNTGATHRWQYFFYLLNPASGANNLVVSASSTCDVITALGYDGAGYSQTGQPDVQAAEPFGSVNSVTTQFTTTVDNDWAILFTINFTTPPADPTAGAGLIFRIADGSFHASAMFDSNGPITPPQLYTMVVNQPGTPAIFGTIAGAFSPATAPPLPTGWWPIPDQPLYSRKFQTDPASIALTPATLPPKIAGMAWFEPPDHPVYSKKHRTDPPAIALTPATLPPKIAGMAWFEPPDHPIYSKPVMTTPGTYGTPKFLPPVDFGMAWFEPPDQPFYGRKAFSNPGVWVQKVTIAAPSGMPWFEPLDQPFYSKPAYSTAPALGSPFNLPTGIFGMAWFEPPDQPVYSKPIWIGNTPPAFGSILPPAAPISGMAWFEPLDQPFYSVKAFSIPGVYVLPTAPTKISGMGWFNPLDQQVYSKPVFIGTGSAFNLIPSVVPVVTGMAWFEPLDQPFYSKPVFSIAPAYGTSLFVPPKIAGIGWFNPWDQPVYGRRIFDQATPAPFRGGPPISPVGIAGMAWFTPLDQPYYTKPVFMGTSPASLLSPGTLPPKISGMGWFNPLDSLYFPQPVYRSSLPPSWPLPYPGGFVPPPPPVGPVLPPTPKIRAIDGAYGNPIILRIYEGPAFNPLFVGDTVNLVIGAGQAFGPNNSLLFIVVTRPDGTQFELPYLQAFVGQTDYFSAVGRFLAGTYVAGEILVDQAGLWQVYAKQMPLTTNIGTFYVYPQSMEGMVPF